MKGDWLPSEITIKKWREKARLPDLNKDPDSCPPNKEILLRTGEEWNLKMNTDYHRQVRSHHDSQTHLVNEYGL